MSSSQPSNLLYLPLGLHPNQRCLPDPVTVPGRLRVRAPLQFWSISADEIRFGDCSRSSHGIEPVSTGLQKTVEGAYRLPAGGCLSSDLVVSGDLHLERNTCVLGSIQVGGSIWMEEYVDVAGNIQARGSVHISSSCRIAGSIMARYVINLAERCVVGSVGAPMDIRAAMVRICEGCRVYGQVSAEQGVSVRPGLQRYSDGHLQPADGR